MGSVSGGGGHAITIHGKSNGNYKIHDPEGEDHTVAYSGVTTYRPNYAQGTYTGKWIQTAYKTSGSSFVVAVQSPSLEIRPAPNGLVIDLSPEEMATQMALNEQYEEEFATGNYVGPVNMSSGSFKSCNQVCPNWCWATSATMASSAFTSVSCASDEEAVAEYIFGTPCSTSCPANCDKGGSIGDIASGIRYLSGHSYSSGGVITQSALDSALQHGPVVVGVTWSVSGGGGHAITIHGKSSGNYKIHDPEGEDHTVAYSGVTTYRPNYAQGTYTGKWIQTAYTTSGSASASVAV